jgi:hypothetical protein
MAYVRSILLVAAALVLYSAGAAHSTPTAPEPLVQDFVRIATPQFVVAGKRYAFTWAGGGPAQTYTVKSVRNDGWVLVEVADEVTNPIHFVPGENPVRWLNAAAAISIQEMRPHQ